VWCVGPRACSKGWEGDVRPALALSAEGASAVSGVELSSPLTSTVGVTRRTGLPMICGTCRLRRCFWWAPCKEPSSVDGDMADAGVGGKRKVCSMAGGSE
jgi:hypothetical protein